MGVPACCNVMVLISGLFSGYSSVVSSVMVAVLWSAGRVDDSSCLAPHLRALILRLGGLTVFVINTAIISRNLGEAS